MKDEMISVDVVKTLITETITQVSATADKRQDAHEDRTREQMEHVTKAIDKMADTVAESTKINAKMQAETNKQLAAGQAQFLKFEERHIHQIEKYDHLKEETRDLKTHVDKENSTIREDVQGLKEEQIADTLTRKVTWRVGAIALTGTLGGAFLFAWWLARTITGALIESAKAGVTP